MRVTCYSSLAELLPLREAWTTVHSESSQKSPFTSFEFVELWYRHFLGDNSARVYAVEDHAQPIGFLPLVCTHRGPFRVLKSLTNDHCAHSGPVIRRGHEDGFLRAILGHLSGHPHSWDQFVYAFTYSFSDLPGLFPQTLLSSSRLAWHQEIEPSYAVVLNVPFDDYVRNTLSPATRKHYKRYSRRLAQSRPTFRHYQHSAAIDHWQEFLAMEDSGWKNQARSSIRQLSANYQEYYAGLLDLLARRESLHLYFLDIGDTPAASALGYTEGDIFHWAKVAYDESLGEYSPSNMLTFHIIQDLVAHSPEIARFHMFPWDYGYKHRYANEDAQHISTVLFSSGPRGRIIRGLSHLKQTASRIAHYTPIQRLVRNRRLPFASR